MNTQYVEVKMTFGTEAEALQMADFLIAKRLVASADLYKMRSMRMMHEKKYANKEFSLSCITRCDFYNIIKGFVVQNRDREYCPFICTPIIDISKDYAEWVDKQLGTR